MIKVLIQVTAGSRAKNFYDEKTLEYKETRHGSQAYPYPYGFIIGTSAEDGDAMDCYIISKDPLKAGTIVECEPIGLLEQHEDGEIDHKVVAALPGQNVELDDGLLGELKDFIYTLFSQYPDMHVSVGPLHPRETALQHIQEFRDG